MGKGTTIVVVASDLQEEAPVWYLRVKGAADRGARVVTVNAPSHRTGFASPNSACCTSTATRSTRCTRSIPAKSRIWSSSSAAKALDRARHQTLMQEAANIMVSKNHAGNINNGVLAVWPGANTQGAFDLGYTSEATEAIIGKRPDVLFLADADLIGKTP